MSIWKGMVLVFLAGIFQVVLQAQTLTTLHSFSARYTNSAGLSTNGDGAAPVGGLIVSGNTLFGAAPSGGSFDNGVLFKVNTDGGSFSVLYDFPATKTNIVGAYTNAFGAKPMSRLIMVSNTLYGTTWGGGEAGRGTVFSVSSEGTGYAKLHDFTNYLDGAKPVGGLIAAGNVLFGTTSHGGTGDGIVFRLNRDGTAYTNLYSFNGYVGMEPLGELVLLGTTLFGTTRSGGGVSSGRGALFSVNTDGTNFKPLKSFTDYAGAGGDEPVGGMVLYGDKLYGTTSMGGDGSRGFGGVFKVNTNGLNFSVVRTFSSTLGGTNMDGANPYCSLLPSGNTLYGTTRNGGLFGKGTVFAMNPDGTGFINLYNFTGGSDGANPQAGLVLLNNALYGTTSLGGVASNGTIFRLSFEPRAAIAVSGADVILSWPTNVAGFSYTNYALQTASSVVGTFTNIPGATSPYTNAITAGRKFFRLISN